MTALVITSAADASGEELFERLDLPPVRGSLIVNGSTSSPAPGLGDRITDVIVDGVAAAALADGLTVVTGATDAGIFAILGPALDGASSPLVGVAPAGLVSGADTADTADGADGRVPLESHHSHFVLVEGDEWGVETAALLALADALGRRAPSAAVLCGGGPGTQREALGHVRSGRSVVVVEGSGRVADDIAAAVARPEPVDDDEIAEIVAGENVIVFPRAAPAGSLADLLHVTLFGST